MGIDNNIFSFFELLTGFLLPNADCFSFQSGVLGIFPADNQIFTLLNVFPGFYLNSTYLYFFDTFLAGQIYSILWIFALPIFKQHFTIFIIIILLVVIAILIFHIYKFRNIEYRKKRFEESRRELSEINATKDKLFSIIAHDLKNSFHFIIGFSEIALKRFHRISEEEKYDTLKSINETAVKTYELLMNLLQWTRSHANTIKFNPSRINLNLLIKENILLVKESANKKKIRIISDISEYIYVNIDKNMIDTVVRNFITNAIKFTNTDGEVKISTTETYEFVEVTISDTGVGIKEENIPFLFDAKSILISKGTSNEIGTGIGLVLSKEFIERNGGKIKVESIYGKGTSIKFTLPKFI